VNKPLSASDFVSRQLDQNQAFVESLPPGAYGKRVEAVQGSIGGHLRHCLEHVDEWLQGLDRGSLCFEERRRDPRVQGQAAAALNEIQRLRQALRQACAAGEQQRPLEARSTLTGRLEDSLSCASTAERELIYVGLHFVHHMALMAVAARLQGLPVPEDFGKAPATVAYERSLAC
jgi:uncharacterized damage-inducible protein DinB